MLLAVPEELVFFAKVTSAQGPWECQPQRACQQQHALSLMSTLLLQWEHAFPNQNKTALAQQYIYNQNTLNNATTLFKILLT